MLYLISWTYKPEHRNTIQARFKETGGQPPDGVKMVGRWHAIGMGRGVAVAESADPVAVANWAQDWSDLLSFEIHPALDDQDTAATIP